jgi:hypothetical protein
MCHNQFTILKSPETFSGRPPNSGLITLREYDIVFVRKVPVLEGGNQEHN